MREIHREIVSAIIFSQDGKLLMGKKDPAKGGVYSDCWHIPGGGMDEGETLEQALGREVLEEVGIDIAPYKVTAIPRKFSGVCEKVLRETGEKVLCHMVFNSFRIDIADKLASEIELKLEDDLVEARWFSLEELADVKLIPGGKESFQAMGLIPKNEASN